MHINQIFFYLFNSSIFFRHLLHTKVSQQCSLVSDNIQHSYYSFYRNWFCIFKCFFILFCVFYVFVAYMGRIVEEERFFCCCWCGYKIGCKIAVSSFQIKKVHWLLLDDLIVHQWDSDSANITQSKTLDIWRETSQVLTGALWEK